MVRKFRWNNLSESLEKIQANIGEHKNCPVALATNFGIVEVTIEFIIVWSEGRFVCTGYLTSDWNGLKANEYAIFYRLNEDAFYVLERDDIYGSQQAQASSS